MDLKACLDDQIGRLVHPAACTSPVEAARHRVFVLTRLAVAFGALALVPFYLVSGSIPGWAEALVLAWLVVPLFAVLHVSRTGQLHRGELLSLGAWLGLAATLVLGRVCGIGPGIALLLLVPLEAGLCGENATVRGSIAASLFLGGLLIALSWPGLLPSAGTAADPVFYGAAILYACILVLTGLGLKRIKPPARVQHALELKTLADTVGDLVLKLDRAGTVLLASTSSEQLPSVTAADLLGRGLFERVHVADRPAFLKMVSDASVDGTHQTGSIRLRLPERQGGVAEPSFAWVELRLRRFELGDAAQSDAAEHPVLAFMRDVTSRVTHEADMQRAARDAENASAWKDRFLATVSHELRTPLNAIIGFGEILASDAIPIQDGARRKEYAEIVHASGRHLLSVVNSLLDMSKIDAGKFQLESELFEVPDLINACCDMVRLKAEQSRIDLVREIGAPLRPLHGDQRACKQIVLNLLSNALKFTPEYGSVVVSAHEEGDMIAIAVTDTGIGMVAPDMARLGDPFFQAQNAYDRRYEGTGLGLSVVSGLVGLHGGTIVAESAPGEGTRMTVRLPRDGRRRSDAPTKAKIEVLPRHPRAQALSGEPEPRKVQKIA